MTTKLKNLKLTSVDLVRAGANQEAEICIFKSARTISKSDPDRFDKIIEVNKGYEEIVEIEKFNPYHDRLGRFASAGVATSFTYKPGKSKAHDNAIAREVAKQTVSDAKKREPAITKSLQDCARQAGGELVGLDYRLKTEKSLARKISTEMKEKGCSVKEAAASMKDVNRYTMQLSEDNFVSGYNQTMKTLTAQGYEPVRVKNTLQKEDAPYRGVNTNLRSPDGSIWELQFHTKKSLEVKEVNHKLYEIQREDSTSSAKRVELGETMANNAKSIPTPKDIGLIKNIDKLKK